MKSVCLATWYLTIAFGNVIVIIVAEARAIDNQVWEYVFFAGLLGVATIIFCILSYFYKYVNDIDKKKSKANSVEPLDNKEEK